MKLAGFGPHLPTVSVPAFMRPCTDRLVERMGKVRTGVFRWVAEHDLATAGGLALTGEAVLLRTAVPYLIQLSPPGQLVTQVATMVGLFGLSLNQGIPTLQRFCTTEALEQKDYPWLTQLMVNGHFLAEAWYKPNAEGEMLIHRLVRHPFSQPLAKCIHAYYKKKGAMDTPNRAGLTPLDIAFQHPDGAEKRIILLLLYLGASARKSSFIHFLEIDDLLIILKAATIAPDHASPFFPMIESLERFKDQIPGGRGCNDFTLTAKDKGSYGYDPQTSVIRHYPGRPQTVYTYIYKMLLALQELHSCAYTPLIREHNNGKSIIENKAAQLIFNLTGIVIHFDIGDHTKIPVACDMVLQAFAKVKDDAALLAFFLRGFNEKNTCFEGRMAHFQEWIEPNHFTEILEPTYRLATRLGEHFRVFRNKRFREIVGDDYDALVGQMQHGSLPLELSQRLHKLCSKRNFVKYIKAYYKEPPPGMIEEVDRLWVHLVGQKGKNG